nr:hypothetical protein BaRGS_013273 [Batillaria attramentaria]
MKQIMESQEYRHNNELVRKGLCEATIPEYDIIQWSKLFFLHQTIADNPFSNDFFIWLDGGYGRGENIHPPEGIWKPTQLLRESDRVTLLERESVEPFRRHRERLHKMSVNVVAGGFIAGGPRALERLYALQRDLLEEWMKLGVVDDDQTVYMQLCFRTPELFNLVRADWYDAFKLFDGRLR